MGVYERMRDGESLWDDSEFLRSLLENTSEGLLTIDSNSRIVFANPGIERILGYPPDELVGNPKLKIIPERLRPVHQESLERYVRTGEKNFDWGGIELPALHKDGREVPVMVSLREHEYEGEQLFTGIFSDITEQKRRERELLTRKQELEEFAGVLSHDLRNPLSVAQGYTEIASETYAGGELARVETALNRMEEIIDDMLVRSRGRPEDVAAEELLSLRSVMEAAWSSVPSTGTRLTVPDETWKIRAHRGRLKQLAENVFRNALEHGGEDVEIRVGVLETGDGFYIEDTGSGFPDALRDRTWAPNEVLLDSNGGYGLHIVDKIASEHGWRLYLTESSSGGARLEFHDVDSLCR